jgi:site-specific DNA-methyltransferase (adenine-specific)
MANQIKMEFNFEESKIIKGYPELRWTSKRPYKSTQYYPAQLKEVHGNSDKKGWLNKIFWGDNLQVMSHLLKDYRGKVDLIYLDPPFDSKADYKMKIKSKGKEVSNDLNIHEEKQYGDIWTNDEYLQFMYERLILLKELLSMKGQIYVHVDWRKVHYLRVIMDEVFGSSSFKNEIIWCYAGGGISKKDFPKKHDNILRFTKSDDYYFDPPMRQYSQSGSGRRSDGSKYDLNAMTPHNDWWIDIPIENTQSKTDTGYPTQKPEALLERIILASSNEGDLVFDCFMGSGTTQAVAMKLNRRFIGADINLGAVQTTSKRLLGIMNNKKDLLSDDLIGFEVYNVNHYDFFRNPLEAKSLIIDALEIQQFSQSKVFDGEKDGRMIKILPVNRIATKVDLNELIANLPYSTYEKRIAENPKEPAERITLVCMGHEPDLKAALERDLSYYKIDVEVVDILRDKSNLQFKREAEVDIQIDESKLIVQAFYPMNLMQKLSMQKESVDDWRQLVESIMIDFDYDGNVLRPSVRDIPDKNNLVKGMYSIPSNAKKIKVKITDLLSESIEWEYEYGK